MATLLPHPVPGVDYPQTFKEFEAWFRTDDACRDYLAKLRWPSGFECPNCHAAEDWVTGRDLHQCRSCRAQTSVTAGTLFHKAHKPLKMWFLAMWFVTSQKNGASALSLQRILGLGSYHTAWSWLHKLRRAMVRPGREQLSERVEVDETYAGGRGTGNRGRGAQNKMLVAIAAEMRGQGMGRIRMAHIPDASKASLHHFITESIAAGSEIITDGWGGYNGVAKLGYEHVVLNQSASEDPAHVTMPRVHRVASLFDRWLLGTHQGGVQAEHLAYYLDEFTFRFNRRRSSARGLLFHRLMQQAVALEPISNRSLIGG